MRKQVPPAPTRRSFLRKSILASLAALLGTEIVFADRIPEGVRLLAENALPEGKHKDLVVLSDRPWNIETPAHLLDDPLTPVDKMFVRNNGIPPVDPDPEKWTLTIEGEAAHTRKVFTIRDLQMEFPTYSYQLVLECAGNGRSGYAPSTAGNQWTDGAVSCAKWTGVRLSDLLDRVGIKSNAVYVGYYGLDTHLSGDPTKSPISRGIPIRKALEPETLVAWAVNDEPIPLQHGYPLRLVVGGWPASVSGKWLSRLVVRDRVHDGEKMNGASYRLPTYPIAPGEKVPDEHMRIIESMPVKSLITYPQSGAMFDLATPLDIRGHAWAGDRMVTSVEYSIDYGATWHICELDSPSNRLAWQHWRAQIRFPKKGYYEVWAKATDQDGVAQPMVIPAWNPQGYNNNSCHRIAVKVL